jgi:hypothetical protein
MRWNTMVGLMGVASLLAAGCTFVEASDEEGDAGGAGGSAGTGGVSGTGGTPEGGTGGTAVDDPCNGVPMQGECVDETTIRACLHPDGNTGDDHVDIVETQCPPGRVCKVGNNGAECAISGVCVPGDVECSADSRSVRVCEGTGDDAHWVNTACDTAAGEKCQPGTPDSPAACYYVPSSSGGATGPTLAGRVNYEYRPVRSDGMGWGDLQIQDIRDLYITIYDDGEFIGAALSGYDSVAEGFMPDSSFVAKLTREMRGPTSVWAWPIVFDYTTGLPAMAVAKLKEQNPIQNARSANEYWAWGIDIAKGTTDIGTWTITEKEYSGALHIFQWMDYGLLRSAAATSGDQMSLAVYWDPLAGTPTCGACFCGPACGGAQVQYGSTAAETDYYDSWIVLGGPPSDGSTQWARAVISHEFGHYVMQNYSKSPGEGGTHYVNAPSKPGLAYSEAWATAFGCTNIDSPKYVDEQSGSFFWVDISKYTYSGGSLQMADPDGPIDQYINENIGAGMIWKLIVDQSMDPQGRGLGDPKVFGALTYEPLVNGTFNRGYHTVDLIDFFDAALCSGNASVADINAVTQTTKFPYNPATRPCL